MNRRWLAATPLVIAAMLPGWAGAQVPGRHPPYLHALTDLHDARYYLSHRSGPPLAPPERRAIAEINRTMRLIQRAAYGDGKNLAFHPAEDLPPPQVPRLARVSQLLRRARADIGAPEDNPNVWRFRYNAAIHLDRAIRISERMMVRMEPQTLP